MSDQANAAERPVEVTYSAADVLALNAAVWRFWVGAVIVVVGIVSLVPVVFALIDGYPIKLALIETDWSFTFLVAAVVIAWILLASAIKYWWRRRKGLWGPILFTLSADGVRVRNREMDGTVFWSAIKSIKVRGSRVFMFMTRRSALIIPRRALESDMAFEAFATDAQYYWQESHKI